MSNPFVTKPCPNCGCEHDFPVASESDDEIICECGSLNFPSDFGLCEKGYKIIKPLYPPEGN